MHPLLRLAAALTVLSVATGCGSSTHAKPAAAAALHVSFDDSSFSASTCPQADALANCFAGTGTTTITPIGKVSLARTVISGDQKRTAPAGCDPADTVGTLTGAGGTAKVAGTGSLCGAVATYTLVVDGGTGTFAKLRMTGTIHNNGGVESWDIASLTNG